MKRGYYYLILFAIWPVWALFANNFDQVKPWVVLRPLLMAVAGTMLLFGALGLLLRDWPRAGVATAYLLLLYFSYGQVYNLLEGHPIFGHSLAHHSILVVVYLVLLGVGLWWILRRVRRLAEVTQALNIIGIFLLLYPTFQVATAALANPAPQAPATGSQSAAARGQSASTLQPSDRLTPATMQPDVYYIILDMYTRSDTLQQDFGADNSAFLNGLRQLGFYVAGCSKSNYSETRISLASSLNMNYLEALGSRFVPENPDKSPLVRLLQGSLVRRQFEALGYHSVAFATGFPFSEVTASSEFLSPPQQPVLLRSYSPFEALVTSTTAFRLLNDSAPQSIKNALSRVTFPYREHVQRIEFDLDQLAKLPARREASPGAGAGPKFVFAHIVSPHFPFIFAADGSLLPDPRYYNQAGDHPVDEYFVDGYRNQVEFISPRILAAVKQIIASSSTPPIIVIQGDHGVRDDNRMNILNAYYLPGGTAFLYPSISPVNTFRVIENTYFGKSYPLLPDVARLSDYVHPYKYQVIPETAPGCVK